MHVTRGELAKRISRALLDGGGRWSPSLEETLHGIINHQHQEKQLLSPALVSRVIDPYLIRHPSLALGFFHWSSQQPGLIHSSHSYHSLLKSLLLHSSSNQAAAIHSIMKQIISSNIQQQLHPSLYRSLIASFPLHAFSLYWRTHPPYHYFITNSLLASLSSAAHTSHAHQLFDHIISTSLPFTTLGLGVFLWRTTHFDFTSLHLDLDQLNGSILALLVVHGLCLAGRPHEAMRMLDVLRIKGCKPDFMAYRVVAEALRAATGNVILVDQVLKLKRKLGVAPRSDDYRDFIFQLISERLICEAKDLGEVIVAGDFPIEDDVLNALIGSVSTLDTCSALTFFRFLIAKQRLPTLLAFTNLARNLCKHENRDELLQVSKILSAKDYFIDIERYNVMVSFFCKAGMVKEAYRVLQEMKRKGLGPDTWSYNYVMEACCKEDMIRPAKRLWDEMFANGCEPNLKTYNILITKFSEIGQVEEAHTLFCHMLERGVQPDATTYDFLIKGLCQENQLETAIGVFKKSFEQDLDIANSISEKFILYLCKKGEFNAASNLVHDYTSNIRNSKPNMILLKCLTDAGEFSVAIEHMKKFGEISVSLLHELRTKLFSSLSSTSKQQLMMQVIETLHENQVISKTLPSGIN